MKRFLVFFGVWAVALCSLAYGQVSIDGPDKIEPYKLVKLTVTSDCDTALWFFEPAEKMDAINSTDGKTLIFVAPPGTYVINVVTGKVTDGKIAFGQARKSLTIGEGTPANPYQRPNEAYQALVRPMLLVEIPQADAQAVAALWAELAKSCQAEDGPKTTGELRALLVTKGGSLGFKGKYPSLAESHDAILLARLGKENKALNKDEAANTLNAMAWAIMESLQ